MSIDERIKALEEAAKENSELRRNDNKTSDNAFIRLIATSMFAILLCLICLSTSTYAWFTTSITQSGNTIASASACLLEVSVVADGEDESILVMRNVIDGRERIGDLSLDGGVTYKVSLSLPKNSASGYITLANASTLYKSPYISSHNNDVPETVEFYIYSAADVELEVEIRWGIYSDTASVNVGETLVID